MKTPINIGLFGFGCVGGGLFEVLQHELQSEFIIKKICVKNAHKPRSIPSGYFTLDPEELLNNPELSLIIELINDADEAYALVRRALCRGKSVISANKKMLAAHLPELQKLAELNGVALLYEAAVGGSIPIIRTLESFYKQDPIENIEGIVNGTTNYILTQMMLADLSYPEALKQAQNLGFAELNPAMDVEGYDSKFKLLLLCAHAFGKVLKPEEIPNFGIHTLGENDCCYAREKNLNLKLIAHASLQKNMLTAYVMPQFVSEGHAFSNISNEFNAIQIEAAFSDKQLLTGKGAGSIPTAAAVLSDIAALANGDAYQNQKSKAAKTIGSNQNLLLKVFVSYSGSEINLGSYFRLLCEEHHRANYHYLIGYIKLNKLVQLRNSKQDVFVAELPKEPLANIIPKFNIIAEEEFA